ncbi:MAG: hypothetical protein FJ087_16845 [Deltaproteobacteria bacterium]|nr:hypothetical protein [Deltaproteobacteria bacterium]
MQHTDVERFDRWDRANADEIDAAPFFREYVALRDIGERLEYLRRYVNRRPLDPLICPRPGATMDPHRQRAVLTVAYLLGDFAAPDLPRVAEPWTWPAICEWANAHGGEGFDTFRDTRRACWDYKRAVETGALRIVPRPPDVDAVLAILTAAVRGDAVEVPPVPPAPVPVPRERAPRRPSLLGSPECRR